MPRQSDKIRSFAQVTKGLKVAVVLERYASRSCEKGVVRKARCKDDSFFPIVTVFDFDGREARTSTSRHVILRRRNNYSDRLIVQHGHLRICYCWYKHPFLFFKRFGGSKVRPCSLFRHTKT